MTDNLCRKRKLADWFIPCGYLDLKFVTIVMMNESYCCHAICACIVANAYKNIVLLSKLAVFVLLFIGFIELFTRLVLLKQIAIERLPALNNGHWADLNQRMDKSFTYIRQSEENLENKQVSISIACVVCKNRMEQSLVMLKSVIIFSRSKLIVHMFVEQKLQEELQNQLKSWPSDYQKKMCYHIYDIWFANETEETSRKWGNMYQPCAAQRLFIPSLLSDVDALIYIDIDVVLLSPIDDLWALFSQFNSSQLAAAVKEKEAPGSGAISKKDKGEYVHRNIPYYGDTGINTGVLLMNLSRIRAVSWLLDIEHYRHKYNKDIRLGDQDLLNVYFHFHPEYLFELSCDWNYRSDHCVSDRTESHCKAAELGGVRAIHSNRQGLVAIKHFIEPLFKAIYTTFREHDPRSHTEQDLLAAMEKTIEDTNSKHHVVYSRGLSKCANLKHIFLKQMELSLSEISRDHG